MLEYIDKVLVPYLTKKRQELELATDHPALVLFNAILFLKNCVRIIIIHQIFIPAGCTGELQPLDVSVNEQFKASMKVHFARWYSAEVKEDLDQGLNVANLRIDPGVSALKPLHRNWLITAIFVLKNKK